MARPHPALIELAADRPLPPVGDDLELLRSAKEHRMHGLLWSAVKSDEIAVSREVERALAAEFLRTQARHRKFWEALEEVSEKLRVEGIELAAIKGVTAEARWYERMGERPCRDVDIWIAPHHVGRFGEAVRILCPDHPLLEPMQNLVDRGYLQGIDFRMPSGVSVDLHADLLKLGIRTRASPTIWAQTLLWSPSTIGAIRVLSPAAALGLHVMHANIDRFGRLLSHVDIRRLEALQDPDNQAIRALLDLDGLDVPALASLSAIHSSLGLPLLSTSSGLTARLWASIWPPRSWLLGSLSDRWRLRQHWLPFLARARLVEAIAWLVKSAVPPPEMFEYYHPDLRGPYPWRLLTSRFRFWWDWRRLWAIDESRIDVP